MYTDFITLSDIDNRRQKTIVQENTTNNEISLYNVQKAIIENRKDLFKSAFADVMSESMNNSVFFNNNIDKYIDILNEAFIKFDNIDNEIDLFKNSISICNNLNYVHNKILESYIYTPSLKETIEKNKITSRIIKNHNLIKEYINISEPIKYDDSYIIDFCESFDNTFNMSCEKKYIICIEELSYIFDKSLIKYESKDLINDITDYFLIAYDEDANVETIYNNIKKNFINLVNETNQVNTNGIYIIESEDYADSSDIQKTINSFKTDTNKSYSKFKLILTKLYSKSPEQVIDETPNVLSLIRHLILIGAFGVPGFGLIIGSVTAIADYFIKMSVDRSHGEKMFKHFQKELDKAEDLVEKYSDNKESTKYKNALSYAKSLKKCTEKISDYNRDLYSDKELSDNDYEKDRKFDVNSKINKNGEIEKDDDFSDWGFNDFSFDESALDSCMTLDQFYTSNLDAILSETKVIINEFMKRYQRLSTDTGTQARISANYNLEDIKANIHKYISANHYFTLSIIHLTFVDPYILNNVDYIIEELRKYFENIFIYRSAPCNNDIEIYIKFNYKIIFDTTEDDEIHMNHTAFDSDLNKMAYIQTMESYINKLNENNAFNMNNLIRENIETICSNDLISVSEAVIGMGDLINIDNYINCMNEFKNKNKDTCLEVSITMGLGILKDNDLKLSLEDSLELQVDASKIMNDVIHEKVDLATLKLASMNLMNKAKQLGNKEKEMSHNFNISLNKIKNDIEKALTTDKRENIIKGSIIPSASRCLKIALLVTGGLLIKPELTIIGAIGALAISKHLTKKEREMLLQEIEIELKYVEKEISDAESKGNNKKYKQLLIYQNKLLKEQQRIRYNMKVAPGINTVGMNKNVGERS